MAERKPTVFEAKAEVLLLLAYMVKNQNSGTLTWKELAAACNSTNLNRVKSWCQSARRMAKRQHRVVFDAVRGVGLRKLEDAGLVGVGNGALKSIHRKARRTRESVECIKDIGSLPPESRNRVMVDMSLMGAIENASSGIAVKRIGAVIEKTQKRLELDETLEAMRN